jgi:hypothetical protein
MARSITTLNINLDAWVAGLAILLMTGQLSWAQDNPHWNKNTCQTCHTDAAPVDGLASLNAADAESLCESCHGERGGALSCRHVSGVSIGDLTVDESLRNALKDDKIVCSTCHDSVYQCERPKTYYRFDNPGFLRDPLSTHPADYCFKCHVSEVVEKLSPHAGVEGTPAKATCMLCHESIPATTATGQLNLAFNMRTDINDTCRGCHNVRSHPTSTFTRGPKVEWGHLVVPPEDILQNMRENEATSGVILPLEPETGKVFCATCHNPHDFKVGGEHGSQSREVKHRLRQENICQACHEK